MRIWMWVMVPPPIPFVTVVVTEATDELAPDDADAKLAVLAAVLVGTALMEEVAAVLDAPLDGALDDPAAELNELEAPDEAVDTLDAATDELAAVVDPELGTALTAVVEDARAVLEVGTADEDWAVD
jgi:hypothetical protein